ncbi:MAG TPA: hypothetical protein VIL34_03045 [Actinopolymorphaceae bacterium]|jgi:hypothetical protein
MRRATGLALELVVPSLLLAGGLYLLGRALGGWRIPFALYVVLALAVVAGRRIVMSTAPPRKLQTPIREDVDVRAFGIPDRPFVDVRKWEDRLELAHGDLEHFRRHVLPAIAAMVDERLRLRYGINRTTHPERARELLGTRLWEFLETGSVDARTGRTATRQVPEVRGGKAPARAPTPAELTLVIDRLEDLWEPRA